PAAVPLVLKVAVALWLVALGVAMGLASTALHQRWWGLPLAVAAVLATLVALPPRWWTRPGLALGWVGIVGLLSAPRGEGDYVVGNDAEGYLLLGTAFLVLVVSLATLPRPRRADPPRP